MGITFDTNVLLSSTLWEGSVAQKLLFKLIHLDVRINSSNEILDEYKKVLKRDFDYSDEEISRIMKVILSFIRMVYIKEEIDEIKDDPDDNKILECAVESSSKYIITYDKHLLKLGKYKGIKVINPEEAIRIF